MDYPTFGEVLEIHRVLLEEFGGTDGMRDNGGLESALMRPRLGYYSSIIEEAAALMESLAINHPFVDGNKRVAFFTTDVFLRMNGYYMDCDGKEAYSYFMHLFKTDSFRFSQLVEWLENNMKSM